MIFVLVGTACQPNTADFLQPPIKLQMVLHSEPIPRSDSVPCQDTGINNCGLLHGGVIFERTRNWVWLANTLLATDAKLDLQLAPELAQIWGGDRSIIDYSALGTVNADSFDGLMVELNDLNRKLIETDKLRVGLHIHNMRRDSGGSMGELGYPVEGPEPCSESLTNPMVEPPTQQLKENLDWSIGVTQTYVQSLGTIINSFTGHFPRSMANKVALINDVDQFLETNEFNAFQPTHLSSAYSECFMQASDHPSWWSWRSDGSSSIGIGNGPIIQPSLRSTGSMNDHLGAESDASLGSNLRRFVQLLVAHRYAQINGFPPHSWTLGIHTHLFQLYSGSPNPDMATSRENQAVDGNAYREDLLMLLEFIQGYTNRSWNNRLGEKSIVEWDWQIEANDFDHNSTLFDLHSDMSLTMLEKTLKDSHLRDFDQGNDYDLFLFEQCVSGWRWGGEISGFHCDTDTNWVELYLPWEPVCINHSAVEMANVDDDVWTNGTSCNEGRWIYPQGTFFRWSSTD